MRTLRLATTLYSRSALRWLLKPHRADLPVRLFFWRYDCDVEANRRGTMNIAISRRTILLLVCLSGLALSTTPSLAASQSFEVTLTGAQQVPPVDTAGKGTAKLTYDPAPRVVPGRSPTKGCRARRPWRTSTDLRSWARMPAYRSGSRSRAARYRARSRACNVDRRSGQAVRGRRLVRQPAHQGQSGRRDPRPGVPPKG